MDNPQNKTANTTLWFILIVNVLLTAANIYALTCLYPIIKPLNFDYLALLVGVLTILVTVLVCWNIYNAFNYRKEISDCRRMVKEVEDRARSDSYNMSLNFERMSVSIYSALFDEKRLQGTDVNNYFKYGLLVIIHAQNMGDTELCKSMIKVLTESFPVTRPIRNQEKANILMLAAKISETPIKTLFDELHNKLITKLPSSD